MADTHRLIDSIAHAGSRPLGGGPLQRATVDAGTWEQLARELASNPQWSLLALWGEPDAVHLALLDSADYATAIATLPCPARRYPSIGRWHAPAIRLERSIHDLYGIEPEHSPDARPWLDHGRWQSQPAVPRSPTAAYEYLRAEGEGVHGIAVGPVHAGIIEPGHFRFSVNGETVVRLEERLGYVHKGIESLWAGADLARAARLAGRLSGDSTVAASIAFARAVEAAMAMAAPPRAQWLRALMAELERIANHLGDIGAICNDASFALMHSQCGILREHVLRACRSAFGHRLMMDQVVPGGVANDLAPDGSTAIGQLRAEIGRRFPALVELYDNMPSLLDRTVATGILSAELASQYAAGGYVGRASGRTFDTRRAMPYTPYDMLTFDVPVRTGGDVNERVWIRILEIEESLKLIDQILERLREEPNGPLHADVHERRAEAGSEGAALVEGFRGDIFAWVRIDHSGRIDRCHLRDPSWFQWPLLEAVIEGNIVADFPLCNKSFNCSYSGHDG